ncbi:hypothetical protein [Pseudomonas oryzihabitans]|uniref:hypothetical protein n=1 Tax=Pseudomonas oryzihabitans TaxID=47885 RepID=UPI0011A1032C|nr:hypothetical protein [Pseudomonas oryzihabitans]
MIKRPSPLQVVRAQITPWDALLADLALEVLETDPEESAIAEQCARLAQHSLECLLTFTGYSIHDFESTSDCYHARTSGVPETTSCPPYVASLLEIRAGALAVAEQIEDDVPVSQKLVAELANDLKRMETVLSSREYLNSDLAAVVALERAARADRMATARDARPEAHPWETVERLVEELLAAGKDERSLAGIVHQRLGIPQRTFRRWRKKAAT